jgi:hypothetical protein
MKIETHILNETKIAEIISNELIIKSAEDGLDLLENPYCQGFDNIIIYEKNTSPFFLI